jgi:hypothetical protein
VGGKRGAVLDVISFHPLCSEFVSAEGSGEEAATVVRWLDLDKTGIVE